MVLRILPSENRSGASSAQTLHPASSLNGSEQGLQNLVDRIERMRLLGPEFIDVTWCVLPSVILPHSSRWRALRHSGGRTSELTTEMIKFCQGTIGLETCMHLTCTNMQPEKIDIALAVRPYYVPSSFRDQRVFLV